MRLAAGAALAGLACLLAGCLGTEGGEAPPDDAQTATPATGLEVTARCEGHGPGPDWREDSVSVGPFGLLGPGRYLRYARENRHGDFVVKLPAIVEGHQSVALRVPPSERGRVGLLYGPGAEEGTPLPDAPVEVTFDPCPHGRRSGWAGGLLLDDDQRPVDLFVQVAGSPRQTITVGPRTAREVGQNREIAFARPRLRPRIAARVPVGDSPQAVSIGEGAVWATVAQFPEDTTELVRIDPSTNEVASRVRLEEAGDVAAGEGAVWVVSYERDAGYVLLRIDPKMETIEARIPLECSSGRCHADQVAVEPGAIWVTLEDNFSGKVLRIDPSTNEVVAGASIPGLARDIALSEDGVWVVALSEFSRSTVQSASLFRIDPATNQVVATILPDEVAAVSGATTASALAASGHGVWVPSFERRGSDQSIETLAVPVDPASNTALQPIPVERDFIPFAADKTGVWFVGGGIRHLDASTGTVDESVAVEGGVDAVLDTSADVIWTANYEDRLTRINLR